MSNAGMISFILIAANIMVSYRGMTDPVFYDRYAFDVDRILLGREYKRLITSGFLHVSWSHLVFNMLSLYFFSANLAFLLGTGYFLLVYFASLVGGNLFSLFVHRNEGSFRSVGASGAIAGIIFASIAIMPGMNIGLFLLPISIPAWIYGLAYVLYSIYGIRSRRDNVGHEAHLAGALAGMIIAILAQPQVIATNYVAIIAVALPAILFIYFIITQPHLLLVDNQFFKATKRNLTLDQRYNAEKRDEQREVDHILEKIHRKGINSLTRQEKELLDRYSKTVR